MPRDRLYRGHTSNPGLIHILRCPFYLAYNQSWRQDGFFFTLSQIIREGVLGGVLLSSVTWDKAKPWGYTEVLSDKFPEALGPLTLLPCALSYAMV